MPVQPLSARDTSPAGAARRRGTSARPIPIGPTSLTSCWSTAFADIRVAPDGQPPYFVEVKFGYSDDLLVRRLARKYKWHGTSASTASKVVLVIDRANRPDWDHVLEELASSIGGGIVFEVWDEERLRALLAERFGVAIAHITPAALLDVRQAIDRAKGFHAFGGPSLDGYRPRAAEGGTAVALRIPATATSSERRSPHAWRHPAPRLLPGRRGAARGSLLVFESAAARPHGQRDVVELFRRTEPADIVDNRRQQRLRRQLPIALQRLGEALLPKLFSGLAE